ncbi:peptidyl-tRNA hydrolase II [Cylindrobasidium torrendii FP15055 ss-10]|uniref:peptidyl-tRNA hydrolase n=1 Tax=Cylindrobasidium torrendii FP15055 ss-10 TaxID=1314674 RepID=A0A0D7BJ27_9AGAR|nr:peptidyl-tRNA hydrolase II [Cylindrobasidium torrendii FP15055 ss-10]
MLYTAGFAVLSAALGFFAGYAPWKPEPYPEIAQNEELEELDAEDIPDGELAEIQAGFFEQCKLVLVVRTDLKLGGGDISTHAATLSCYKALARANPRLVSHWERTGQAKIALKAKSEDQLLELEAIAKSLNLCARSIKNPALTNGKGERTVLAIGPAPVPLINEVTGKLRLL